MKIKCNTPVCACNTNKYKHGDLIGRFRNEFAGVAAWYDVPKVASSTLRTTLQRSFKNFYLQSKDETKNEKPFRFAFVRNPFDRFASNYAMWTQHRFRINQIRSYNTDFANRIAQLSFKEFVRFATQHDNHHWNPQVCFVPTEVDFIGKFENLQEDFDTVCDKIGIPHQKLPHYNKTKHKHYTEYYDDETREIVAEQYAKDIELFGYKFGE